MAKEIERKFLIKNDAWRHLAKGVYYHQGFLSTDKERVVRIRVAGEEAFLTVKGLTKGSERAEYEYVIPVGDAREMLENLCLKPTIAKYRYKIPHEGMLWEVDEFLGLNSGLIIAEIELEHTGQAFRKPGWVGEEVTGDARYYNANLVEHPYCNW